MPGSNAADVLAISNSEAQTDSGRPPKKIFSGTFFFLLAAPPLPPIFVSFHRLKITVLPFSIC